MGKKMNKNRKNFKDIKSFQDIATVLFAKRSHGKKNLKSKQIYQIDEQESLPILKARQLLEKIRYRTKSSQHLKGRISNT